MDYLHVQADMPCYNYYMIFYIYIYTCAINYCTQRILLIETRFALEILRHLSSEKEKGKLSCHNRQLAYHARIQRKLGAGGLDSSEKSQKYRDSYQYWSGFHEKSQSYQKAFNVGPPSAHQRNAISMAFGWWADDGPL